MTHHLVILRCASLLTPHARRAEWRREWEGELWYVDSRQATPFCLGAFKDAFWLRCHTPPSFRLESPLACLLVLAALAAIAVRSTARLTGHDTARAFLLVTGMSILLQPSVTPLARGEYPASTRFRRWAFMAAKLALILILVYCGALWVTDKGVPVHGLFVASILAMRWAILDQRRRCPECLRLVTSPVRIGQPSQTFLAWYGTELICARGHGLLQVSAIATGCYSPLRWVRL